jgi:hypothetical protein
MISLLRFDHTNNFRISVLSLFTFFSHFRDLNLKIVFTPGFVAENNSPARGLAIVNGRPLAQPIKSHEITKYR